MQAINHPAVSTERHAPLIPDVAPHRSVRPRRYDAPMRPDQADSLILAVAALTNALVGIGTAIVLAILALVLAVSSLRRMLSGRVTPEPRKGGAPADRL